MAILNFRILLKAIFHDLLYQKGEWRHICDIFKCNTKYIFLFDFHLLPRDNYHIILLLFVIQIEFAVLKLVTRICDSESLWV